MGGDDAPAVVVEGAVRAVQQATEPLHVLLFGPEAHVRATLDAVDGAADAASAIEIVDAPDIIGMAEAPVAAVQAKPNSSIHLGLGAHRQGHADAFLSAGNTGAIMAASLFVLGRLPGVARPSISTYYPTTEGVCLVLDVGSNMDSKPEHLLQFAQMGSIYAQRLLNVEQPAVGLLNVGEEPGKGNELVKAAYPLLEQAPDLRFVGNVEGRDIMHHRADVVVCDGFVGNVVLKLGESIMTALVEMLYQEVAAHGLAPEQQQAIRQVFGSLQKRFNPEEYGGGAPLLGVDGTVFIGHGSSSARAIERLILMAARAATLNVTRSIAEAFQTPA